MIFVAKFRRTRWALRELLFRARSLVHSFGPHIGDLSVTKHHTEEGLETYVFKIGKGDDAIFMLPTGEGGEWLVYENAGLWQSNWFWLRDNLPSARFHAHGKHLVMNLDDSDHAWLLMMAV